MAGEGDEENKENGVDGEANLNQNLKIFQSESRFDDDYSQYEGGADVAGRSSRPQPHIIMNDDDDVRSGNFHSELREQFQNANPAKKVTGGILKYSENPPKNGNDRDQKQEEY